MRQVVLDRKNAEIRYNNPPFCQLTIHRVKQQKPRNKKILKLGSLGQNFGRCRTKLYQILAFFICIWYKKKLPAAGAWAGPMARACFRRAAAASHSPARSLISAFIVSSSIRSTAPREDQRVTGKRAGGGGAGWDSNKPPPPQRHLGGSENDGKVGVVSEVSVETGGEE